MIISELCMHITSTHQGQIQPLPKTHVESPEGPRLNGYSIGLLVSGAKSITFLSEAILKVNTNDMCSLFKLFIACRCEKRWCDVSWN